MSPFEEGPEDAPVCLIGEAPSAEEIREGRPFVGPAGRLLDRCLEAAGIRRSEVRILNVFETQVFKPRGNAGRIEGPDGTLWWTSARGFTEAGRAASAGCLERLLGSKANVIVPLGGPALHACVDTRSVTKWRGSIIEANERLKGRKAVPTIHPSAALQGVYEDRWLIAADLKRVKEESKSPEIRLPRRELILDPGFEEALGFLRRALDADIIDTDIELLKGQVDCFSAAVSPSEAISIPLIGEGFENRWPVEEERAIWEAYAKLISSPRITKVNQNICFDLSVLLRLNGIVPAGNLEDPMVAFSVMNPFLSKSLGTICSLYTREPYYKDGGELHDSPTVKDFARRWRYNALDAAVSLEAWSKLEPELDRDGYRETYELTMGMASGLIYMMTRGIKANRKALTETREKVKEKLSEVLKRAEVAFGRPIYTEVPEGKGAAARKRLLASQGALNINSPKQVCAYFYEEQGLTPYIDRKTGNPSADDDALARIVRRDGNEAAAVLLEYRRLFTLDSRYLNMGFDHDERLRCSYNIRGTWTGRLSSSQTVFKTGGNQQNLPDDMRGFLVADEPLAKE